MDFFEFMILMISGAATFICMINWYSNLPGYGAGGQRSKAIKFVLALLPIVSFFIILYTLKVLASFDVVNDFIYIVLYIFLGFAWIFTGIKLVFIFFDISWIDDALNLNNKAAVYAIVGAFLGIVTIYSGANIGDGPGWWCVVFAGGLGTISWFFLGFITNKFTQVFERITVERDIYCGIRFGCYLLASGIVLARASAGDWTSFASTIVEFLVGWPVLVLTMLAIAVERYYIHKAKVRESINDTYMFGSVYWGITYIFIAVVSIILFPLVENPLYDTISLGLLGAIL